MPIIDIGGVDPTQYLISLDELSNVYAEAPFDGAIIQYNEASGLFLLVPATGFSSSPSIPSALTGLTDTSIVSPLLNQNLFYDGSLWTNRLIRLADVSGVNFGNVVNGQVLWYTGGNVINAPLPFSLLSGVALGGAVANQVLGYNGTNWIPIFSSGGGSSSLSGLTDVRVVGSGQGSILEVSGNQWIASPTLNTIKQSYLSGIVDLTYAGVAFHNQDITSNLQSYINSAPSNLNIRLPAGNYTISNTILISTKQNWSIDATQANIFESQRLPSGIFRIENCSNFKWNGGTVSGADTLSYILGFCSGIEMSGLAMTDFGPSSDNAASVRYVIGQVFSTNICTGVEIRNVNITNKYRVISDNNSLDYTCFNINHVGCHTGFMYRADEVVLAGITGTAPNTGVASAVRGDIWKETARTTYTFNLNKTQYVMITNSRSKNTGGLLNGGSVSIGGGGGNPSNWIIANCYSRNPYDNGIYVSSAHRVHIHGVRVISDSTMAHSVECIKGRGSDIIFSQCYVERGNAGYGIEGFGSTSDYWNGFKSQGWSSEGCKILHCTAKDIGGPGLYLDRNNNIYPRDVLIEGNTFYNCGLGPWGKYPTGYLTVGSNNNPAIAAVDAHRVRIVNNTIEYTGSFQGEYAIVIGSSNFAGYLTGCVVRDNIILGSKQGVKLVNIDHARLKDNYFERLGFYGEPFVEESGIPAMFICENVRNSRFTDNMMAPTGHAAAILVKPNTV